MIGVIILAGAGMSLLSHQAPELGLVDGRLRPCPDSPNCVCSEGSRGDTLHFIEPISASGMHADVEWKNLIAAIQSQGGEIVQQSETYLHATFTSSIFRFIDDVEARLDRDTGLIHLRSASRVGRSDLGANRKRIEGVRRVFGGLHVEH
ncbi:MAG TPA: DUF1499 domain-containing protein [Mariprofundaceae bacterium]|nr:DUF1499 domain-containing protein [Mariprofundaceae bacterium]